MYNESVRIVLSDLYRIVDAGEKGFATSAADISNPGIKLLMKTYARQRARFKEEILAELVRGGTSANPGVSIPGMVHRGRVAIFAALVIEEDWRARIILNEAALGEKAALRTYEHVRRMSLPGPVHELVERQALEVRKVSETIDLLRKRDENSVIMRFYDSEQSAQQVIELLTSAGFPQDRIDEVAMGEVNTYTERGITAADTLLSGIVGGAIWGGLLGILAGYGVAQSLSADPFAAPVDPNTWALTALAFLLLGALISGLMGLFIGMGISENGPAAHHDLASSSFVMLRIPDENTRANEACRIMDQFRNSLEVHQVAVK